MGDFPLSKPVSGLNSAMLLPQKAFARGWGGAWQGGSQRAPEILGDDFGHSCRQALA